jgi:hypothetical protein
MIGTTLNLYSLSSNSTSNIIGSTSAINNTQTSYTWLYPSFTNKFATNGSCPPSISYCILGGTNKYYSNTGTSWTLGKPL